MTQQIRRPYIHTLPDGSVYRWTNLGWIAVSREELDSPAWPKIVAAYDAMPDSGPGEFQVPPLTPQQVAKAATDAAAAAAVDQLQPQIDEVQSRIEAIEAAPPAASAAVA